MMIKHLKGKKTAPFIDDVIVRPEFLPKFLPELENILSLYPELEHTIAGHPGDGNFHIIPLVDINDQKIKNIFDPKNIFNPGKKVEGTKEYIFSHLTVK